MLHGPVFNRTKFDLMCAIYTGLTNSELFLTLMLATVSNIRDFTAIPSSSLNSSQSQLQVFFSVVMLSIPLLLFLECLSALLSVYQLFIHKLIVQVLLVVVSSKQLQWNPAIWSLCFYSHFFSLLPAKCS